MSNEVNGTDVVSTPDTVATIDHGNPTSDGNTPAAVKGTNHDRLEQAYAQATKGKQLQSEPNIESLATMELPDGDHKGIDYSAVMQGLPDDAKKILANLRKDYTQKTQALAAQSKDLEAQRKSLLESDAYKSIQNKANETPVDADPFDPVAFNTRIEQEVAKRLNEVLKPMQQEHEAQQRRMRLDKFKSDNPDLETYKTEIVEVLKGNEHITLEQAYFLVKGKTQTEALKKSEQELAAYKTAAKEYGMKVSVGTATNGQLTPPATVKRDAYSVYRWLQANQKV